MKVSQFSCIVFFIIITCYLSCYHIIGHNEPDQLVKSLVNQISRQKHFSVAVVGIKDRQLELKTTTALVNHKPANLTVVSRTLLDAALKELKFQYSDLFDKKKRQRLGKFLGADALVVGDIEAQTGNKINSLFLVDVESAEIIAAASGKIELKAMPGILHRVLQVAQSERFATIAIVGANAESTRNSKTPNFLQIVEEDVAVGLAMEKAKIGAKIKILSRFKLDKLLQELKFQLQDLVDPNQRKKLGQFSGAEAILVISPTNDEEILNVQLLQLESAQVLFAENCKYLKGDYDIIFNKVVDLSLKKVVIRIVILFAVSITLIFISTILMEEVGRTTKKIMNGIISTLEILSFTILTLSMLISIYLISAKLYLWYLAFVD